MWKLLAAPFRIFGVIGSAADAAEFGLNSMVKSYRRSNEVSDKRDFMIHQGNLKRALLEATKEVVVADIKLQQEIASLGSEEQKHFDTVKAQLAAAWEAHVSRQPATVEE